MSTLLYRNHVIIPFPSFDSAAHAWAPQAAISRFAGASRYFRFMRFPKRLTTEEEAIACALKMAEKWIDRGRWRPVGRNATQPRDIIEILGALKQSLEKAAGTSRRGATAATRSGQRLTFDQFKASVSGSGVPMDKETLQKSYAALIKLRESEHMSWAEARRLVEHSRHKDAVAAPGARQRRAARLPLTQRDWRKIS